eukprot:s617_g21.t1
MICRDGYRVELRYVCKACHATTSQLQRNGINVQKLLGEEHLVQFFSEAALERRNSSENRLSWGQSRALLKKTMEGTVVKDCEARLVQMENDASQRRSAAVPAPGVAQLDLELAIEVAEKKRKATNGPMTEAEKAARKQQRVAEKQAEQKRKAATASAAKYLPALKAALQKAALQKVSEKKDRMGAEYEQVPEATRDQVAEALTDLEKTVTFATKLLDAAAKGKALNESVPWDKEKDLQAKVKAANEAARAIADLLRAGKPSSKGRGRGGGNEVP